jgi:hypothetical protein
VPLTFDAELDLPATPAADLELDPVRERQGDAQTVIAGTQVR